ncbi:MAG: hypothetical protein IPK60_07815 [Sandaracinaceae bacterium]|nr:hypothetical protein [Sandaracinaceae bacterium]
MHLRAVRTNAEWALPAPAELLIDHSLASAGCRSDKWVGASCWYVRARAMPQQCGFRVPFLSPDAKNDWTAVLDAQY